MIWRGLVECGSPERVGGRVPRVYFAQDYGVRDEALTTKQGGGLSRSHLKRPMYSMMVWSMISQRCGMVVRWVGSEQWALVGLMQRVHRWLCHTRLHPSYEGCPVDAAGGCGPHHLDGVVAVGLVGGLVPDGFVAFSHLDHREKGDPLIAIDE